MNLTQHTRAPLIHSHDGGGIYNYEGTVTLNGGSITRDDNGWQDFIYNNKDESGNQDLDDQWYQVP